ncbi:MAG: fibronectin type III-like domain-contianing protein [Saprospiraceae bacterium]
MSNRTYRYYEGEPLFPFGFGLSYTQFKYDNLNFSEKIDAGNPLQVTVKVSNTGNRAGDEVVQLYLQDLKASTPRPMRQLEGFERIHLEAGETKEVSFTISPRQFSIIDKNEKRTIESGDFLISVGGQQPGLSPALKASSTDVISRKLKIKGR